MIAATSYVAQQAVLPAIVASPGARLVAMASKRADAWRGRARFEPERVYGSYAALLDDPEVDAVYVPLPNSLHRSWVERAAAVEALVASGRLGALRFARAAFTGVLARHDDHRWRPEMGGGALLDVGIYCVAPLLAAAGRVPARVEAAAVLAKSGVDSSFSAWLDFGDGFAAVIECSFDAPERQSLEIVGTEAAVLVDRAHTPGLEDVRFALRNRDGRVEEIVAGGADPYREMIEHFSAVVRDGARSRRSCADSITLLAVVDRLREAAGLTGAA